MITHDGGRTGWRLVVPAKDEPISLCDAKTFLNISHAHDDVFIGILITAAREYIEARDHILSPQTWEMTLDRFPACRWEPVRLWKRPVVSVESIDYIDSDGNPQTWSPSEYQTALTSDPPRIVPVHGGNWPTVRCQPEAVTIRFKAGYSNSPVETPSRLVAAMLLLIGHLYSNREAVVVIQGVVSVELPIGLEALIDSVVGRARVY